MNTAMTFAGPPPSDLSVILPDEAAVARCTGKWLDAGGMLRLLPAAVYQAEAPDTVQAFAARHARYVFPTCELVDWLASKIAGREALEICAGQGDLGTHLGIRMTDSYQQLEPDIRAYYLRLGQTTSPPPAVRKMDALKAVRKFRPQVVIGGFVTHRFRDGMANGNKDGVDEEAIIALCQTYIMIGNARTHADKPALKLPHRAYRFPGLVTRARFPQLDTVYVWER